ncbi:hypothetical protein BGZ74_005734 [Mortierella antarctica]|nr:hypothetical protein BGZ74_005734 [Mortierella antarctica]
MTVSTATIAPTPTTNLSSAEISKALDAKDNTFTYYYFKLHTHGATARALLAYAEADWTEIHPSDWFNVEKPLLKFGTLPVLYEHSRDGKVVVEHAEAMGLEIRLARKFGLLGVNAFEETQILGFFSNTRAVMHRHEEAYFAHGQFRIQDRDEFFNGKLAVWIRTHEAELKKNGSNGHYVGDSVTLADIKTAVALDSLLNEQYQFKQFEGIHKLINAEATPNLWKVRETVRAKKSYADWLLSDKYKEISAETTTFFDWEYGTKDQE